MGVPTGAGNYPPGVTDNDPHFDSYDDPYDDQYGDYVECWQCGGEGYSHHECGEDTCCCLNPYDNVRCDICEGKGGWPRPTQHTSGADK